MAFTNLPPNLQDMFNNLQDQINKLVTGPNQAMYTAESAQAASAQAIQEAAAANAQGVQALAEANIAIAQGTQAINDANNALQQAQASYALGSQAIIKNAYTVTNASNQLTAINGTGITVYSGASSSSGARVVMNSAGLAGYDGSGNATFSILSSTGAVSTTGAIFTNSSISGGSLNINGNCIINSSGYLTATGATITGAITATSGTFTGTVYASAGTFTGTITSSNATITGGSLTVGANFQVNSSGVLTASSANVTGTITTSNLTATGGTIGGWNISSTKLYTGTVGNENQYLNAAGGGLLTGSYTMGTLALNNTLLVSSTITAVGHIYAQQAINASTTAATNCYISSTGQILKTSTTSSQRYKENITDISNVAELDPKLLLQIPVKAFTYIEGHVPDNDDRAGQMLPGFIAEDIDAIYPIAADYDGGNVETWSERYIIPGLLALVQDQEKRIKLLEGK